jgi:hypothetical protein
MMARSGEEEGLWEGRRVGESSLRTAKEEQEMSSSMVLHLEAAVRSSVRGNQEE